MLVMKKYARIVENIVFEIVALPEGLKPENIFSNSVEGMWIACNDNVGPNWYYDGKTFKAPLQAPKPDLKQNLSRRIDQDAETERLKYITDGVGQSMTYTEKFNQAVDYSKKYAAHQADPKNVTAPVENEYPLLRASIGIDGSSMIEVAETVTYAFALWEKIGAAIEGIRLKAKAAIGDAKTAEEAQAVFASIKWPTMENQANAATS